jgi:hypothetical protein
VYCSGIAVCRKDFSGKKIVTATIPASRSTETVIEESKM